MQVELYCANCCCRLVAPPETSAVDILDRMDDQGQGPWYALGDGETFEDMIFNALTEEAPSIAPTANGRCRCVRTA